MIIKRQDIIDILDCFDYFLDILEQDYNNFGLPKDKKWIKKVDLLYTKLCNKL